MRRLKKVSRVSAYLLLIVCILYIISGYSITGKYGFESIMEREMAIFIHLNLDIIFIILFVLHAGIEIYLRLFIKH